MFLLHKDKMIFFHNPKVAGSSITQFFLNCNKFMCEPEFESDLRFVRPYMSESSRHVNVKQAIDFFRLDEYGVNVWNEYFKFAFVRNPWDRTVSLYHFNSQNTEFSERFVEKYPVFDSWVKDLYECFMFGRANWNCIPQHLFTHANGEQVVDFVGRYENLNDDFEIVKSHMFSCVEEGLSWTNSSKHDDWKTYYKEQAAIDRVSEIFAEDIEFFGYEF